MMREEVLKELEAVLRECGWVICTSWDPETGRPRVLEDLAIGEHVYRRAAKHILLEYEVGRIRGKEDLYEVLLELHNRGVELDTETRTTCYYIWSINPSDRMARLLELD